MGYSLNIWTPAVVFHAGLHWWILRWEVRNAKRVSCQYAVASKLCLLPAPLASSSQPQLPCSFLLKYLQSSLSQAFSWNLVWGDSLHNTPPQGKMNYGEMQNQAAPGVMARIKTLPTHKFQADICHHPSPSKSPTLLPIKFPLEVFRRQRSPAFLSPKCILVLPPFLLTGSFLLISHWLKSIPSPIRMLGPLWDPYSGNSFIPSLLRIPCSLPIPSTSLQFHSQLRVSFIFNLKYHRWSYFNKWQEIKHFIGLQMLSQVWQPLYSPRNHEQGSAHSICWLFPWLWAVWTLQTGASLLLRAPPGSHDTTSQISRPGSGKRQNSVGRGASLPSLSLALTSTDLRFLLRYPPATSRALAV